MHSHNYAIHVILNVKTTKRRTTPGCQGRPSIPFMPSHHPIQARSFRSNPVERVFSGLDAESLRLVKGSRDPKTLANRKARTLLPRLVFFWLGVVLAWFIPPASAQNSGSARLGVPPTYQNPLVLQLPGGGSANRRGHQRHAVWTVDR
jgi:hypothetical protein